MGSGMTIKSLMEPIPLQLDPYCVKFLFGAIKEAANKAHNIEYTPSILIADSAVFKYLIISI